MLIELSIKNFAIIDSLTLSFGPGLNIFTGETGAGKSIIMDAISLILGDRASNEIIRDSKEEAQVEAAFDSSAYRVIGGILEEAGIRADENLIIKRVIQRAGRNKIYINGSLATLVTLTEVGRRLIDIYGQSEHQSLTRPEEHIELLDSFSALGELRADMSESYRRYVSVKKDFDGLTRDSKTLDEKKDFLAHELKEISDANLTQGEEEQLKRERERLRNAEKIKSAASGAEKALYSDTGAVVERMGWLLKALKEASKFDDKLKKPVETIEASLFQIEDAASFLRDYGDSLEADPEGLEQVEARLDLIGKLKKKYGRTVEEIIAREAVLEGELAGFSSLESRLKGLEVELHAVKDKASDTASRLTEARIKGSNELKKRVEGELSDLGMKGSLFDVAIETDKNPDSTPRFQERGSDRVSFLISANPGEPVKPLARIASGGELSRIMLAIKSVTALDRVGTLIFDEIDTGIGGTMAQVVGVKIKDVSRSHQVFCITHLPQIAAFADRHFSVQKQKSAEGRTVTSVKEVEGEERIEQISCMLGGTKVTDITREHARELVEAARSLSSNKKKTSKR